MKSIVLYYSKTGNTKMIAETIARHSNINSLNISDYLDLKLNNYDLIIFGTPVHSDNIPEKVRLFFDKYDVLNNNFAIYCVHAGQESLGSHIKCFNEFEKLINSKKGNVIGKLNLMGENKNLEVIEWLKNNMPERYNNLHFSKGHPDKDDIAKAILWLDNIIKNLNEEI